MNDKVTCRIRIDKNLSYLEDNQRELVKEFLSNAGSRLMETFMKFAPKKK